MPENFIFDMQINLRDIFFANQGNLSFGAYARINDFGDTLTCHTPRNLCFNIVFLKGGGV